MNPYAYFSQKKIAFTSKLLQLRAYFLQLMGNKPQKTPPHYHDVNNCKLSFKYKCSLSWYSLNETEDDSIRFCKTCQKNVYACYEYKDIFKHRKQEHCISVMPNLREIVIDVDTFSISGEEELESDSEYNNCTLGLIDDVEPCDDNDPFDVLSDAEIIMIKKKYSLK